MNATGQSCLVQKLSHYVDLGDVAQSHLARLEREERHFGAQQDVRRIGDPIVDLYVVKRGWVYESIDMPDGRRQIVKLHHPGDVVGLHHIAFTHATTVLRTAEEAVLCPFPKAELDVVFNESPRLTALLFTLALRDNATVLDLLRGMGRMSARERLAYQLLEIRARLAITNRQMTDTIRMPLTQSELGDLLGLTNVYVSRTFSALETEGFLRRTSGHIRLLRIDDLRRLCDFHDRHASLDTEWFPKH